MATNNLSKGYTKNLNNFTYLKTPLEKVADFLGDKIEELESIRTYKEDEPMSEADKIEERGIAQFEDDRQSNFDRE